MTNSLSTDNPSPPDTGGNALSSQAPQQAPQQPPQGPQAAQPQAGQPQAPTREQTMAGLRHFDAVKRQLEVILANPSLGKSNMKSKIIDGVTALVSEGFLQPASAVSELSKVPSEPLMQLQWVKTMRAQAQQAENAILDHYGLTNPHLGTVADHFAMPVNSTHDDHAEHLSALMANYGRH